MGLFCLVDLDVVVDFDGDGNVNLADRVEVLRSLLQDAAIALLRPHRRVVRRGVALKGEGRGRIEPASGRLWTPCRGMASVREG